MNGPSSSSTRTPHPTFTHYYSFSCFLYLFLSSISLSALSALCFLYFLSLVCSLSICRSDAYDEEKNRLEGKLAALLRELRGAPDLDALDVSMQMAHQMVGADSMIEQSAFAVGPISISAISQLCLCCRCIPPHVTIFKFRRCQYFRFNRTCRFFILNPSFSWF